MNEVQAHLFGRLRVRAAGQDVDGLDGAKVQELLCYLLLHHDRPHPRETLAGLLWGERPTEVARKYLRQTLWQLQSALQACSIVAGNLIQVETDWISLTPVNGFWVDIIVFERAFHGVQGVAGEHLDHETVGVLRNAIDSYDGDLLEGWYQDWCLIARERLQMMYLALLDKLMASCETSGDIESGLDYGARTLQIDRAREATHRRLMRLYALYGDRTGALRQFSRCRTALRDDLGVEPARATLALYEAIRQDRLGSEPVARHEEVRQAGGTSLTDAMGQIQHLHLLLEDLQRFIQRELPTFSEQHAP